MLSCGWIADLAIYQCHRQVLSFEVEEGLLVKSGEITLAFTENIIGIYKVLMFFYLKRPCRNECTFDGLKSRRISKKFKK